MSDRDEVEDYGPDEEDTVGIWTTAPRAYDYGYVLYEYDTPYTYRGARLRKVRLPASRAEYQQARYLSGLYVATSDFADLLEDYIVVEDQTRP